MPLPSENAEIVLRGLDQKTSAKLQAPGTLERARNVQFDKAGQLDKRTGYAQLEATQLDGAVMPAVLSRVFLDGEELVIASTTRAFAMQDPSEGMQAATRALVQRGYISSGNVSTFTVAVSTDTED